MTIMLTSRLDTYKVNEQGEKITLALTNHNQLLTNLKKSIKDTKRIVVIANDPQSSEENDTRFQVVFESFKLTGFDFKERVVLDARNASDAKNILLGADVIILSGGKVLCQNKFLRAIKLTSILKEYKGLVIGISAGTMNLCKKVANFPEELADLKQKRWVKGLGYHDDIIIPHFDGVTKSYQIECDEIDVVNDYVLPYSHKHTLIGYPNGSYIFIDDKGNVSYHGDMYIIEKGEIKKR